MIIHFVFIVCVNFTSRAHYSADAFLMDPELCEVVLQLLKGMTGFLFQYDYTSALLNIWQPYSLELAGLSSKDILIFLKIIDCTCIEFSLSYITVLVVLGVVDFEHNNFQAIDSSNRYNFGLGT